MSELLATQWQQIANTSWPVMITVVCFTLALRIYKLSRFQPLCHPLLISSPVVAWLVYLLPIDFITYSIGNGILFWLLGPATVALAVPLAAEVRQLPRYLWQILISILIGGFLATFLAIIVAQWLGVDPAMIGSIAAKSVTTPIAIGITQQIGGIIALIVPVVLVTGLIGIVFADWIFSRLAITDVRWQGLILGIACHAIGTAKAFEKGSLCGAFATLGMGLNGIWTALFLPLIMSSLAAPL